MDLILPFLKHPGFHIIASISPSNYEQYITKNEALLEEFNLLEIKEPSFAENILILQGLCSTYESYLQIFFTFPAIKRIMELSQKYLWKEPFPMKAIHLLEKVTQYAMANKLSLIGKEIIEDVFEEMTKIKVGKIKQQEKNLLLNLENIFHQRVVDQEEAIKLLAEAVRIKRAGIKSSPKPIGSFLFLGPTGVGKTETAKTLAQCYFGSEDTMIRFDMSEYQNKQDVYRFIGNPRTQMPGQLTEAVKENPFALILLDEIEKAHPDILNLFLQVLDEGFLTDVFGQKVYFSNHIIIATSNAGSDYLIQLLKNKLPFSDIQKRLFDYLIKQRLFRVELLNRFDKVIYFKPLGLNEILQIANIKIGQLKDELFSLKRINLEIGPEAVKTLALLGYKEEFGARELERTIREKVESLIAKKIIEESASSGGSIHIGVEDLVVENKVNS